MMSSRWVLVFWTKIRRTPRNITSVRKAISERGEQDDERLQGRVGGQRVSQALRRAWRWVRMPAGHRGDKLRGGGDHGAVSARRMPSSIATVEPGGAPPWMNADAAAAVEHDDGRERGDLQAGRERALRVPAEVEAAAADAGLGAQGRALAVQRDDDDGEAVGPVLLQQAGVEGERLGPAVGVGGGQLEHDDAAAQVAEREAVAVDERDGGLEQLAGRAVHRI
jgi:hypothetical protein